MVKKTRTIGIDYSLNRPAVCINDEEEVDNPKKKKKTDTGEKPDEIDLNPDVEEGKKK